MEFDKNIRVYSLLGQRGTFGSVIYELAKDNKKIAVMSADLTRVSGLERYAEDYPDRYYNVGIAEQNMIGVAAGMADAGRIPFAVTFANFAALRSNEFVRHYMSYMNCNIRLVGIGSGFSMGLFGNTHYGIEDIAVLRSMPGITILSPCDGIETAHCVEWCTNNNVPVYLRLSGQQNNPMVHKKGYKFNFGKGEVLSAGEDVVIYATGSMTSIALKAAEMLKEDGITICVINIHTIKPIDKKLIREKSDYPLIVTVEEHSRTGGLGSAVAETLSDIPIKGKVIRMGTGDLYEKAGTYDYMLKKHGLTVEGVASTVKENLK